MGSTGVKFQLIHDMEQREDNLLTVTELCRLAGVSRSGYYGWKDSAGKRILRERQDAADFQLILEAYNYRGYAKGARGIHMRLLRMSVLMNVKKIRRLMKKFGLVCPIRRPNPHRQIAKTLKTNNTAPNLLNREFTSHGPRTVLLTDITYIPLQSRFYYLSVIIDAYTKQVLSYVLSQSLEVDFVLQTIEKMFEKHGDSLNTDALIHSDQGCHYTSYKFIQLLKDHELRQSMSRKGNCWDNAPQESFFGHMKDEIDISSCDSFQDLSRLIDDWMDYYNRDRYQWQLNKLSPDEFFSFITTGFHPLNSIS